MATLLTYSEAAVRDGEQADSNSRYQSPTTRQNTVAESGSQKTSGNPTLSVTEHDPTYSGVIEAPNTGVRQTPKDEVDSMTIKQILAHLGGVFPMDEAVIAGRLRSPLYTFCRSLAPRLTGS